MPTKRKYNVSGTKDFIVLAGIFFFLCLWAIKDAWYPSDKVLEEHPREIAVAFEIEGIVGKLHVAPGDSGIEEQVLAELRRAGIQEKFDASVKTYSEAKRTHSHVDESLRTMITKGDSSGKMTQLKADRIEAQTAMDSALKQLTLFRQKLDLTELYSSGEGTVKAILVPAHSQVKADQAVLLIVPDDHFYLFNQSLAIFSFIAFWVFLGIHILAQ